MTFIIAEAGVNHNGDIQEAHRLIVAAKRAGADAVKFQHFSSQRLWGDDRIAHLELLPKHLVMLKEQAEAMGLEFMCTAFDLQCLDDVLPLVRRIKISSGMMSNRDMLNAAAATGTPALLSTGMHHFQEVADALGCFPDEYPVTLLQCTSSYPCDVADVHLNAMLALGDDFCLPVGLSDHTTTVSVPIAAAALGATVIEKHLTMSRTAKGPDHLSSLDPHGFASMVHGIRQVEAAMGNATKIVQDCELELRSAWRDQKP